MQLQRSLFSFYKVFTRKTPIFIWITLSMIFGFLLLWQTVEFSSQKPVYNFDQCLIQYFNATRGTRKTTKENANSQNDKSNKTAVEQSKTQQVPFFLQSQYYNVLNQTSTIRVYLSDQIEYKQGEPSCRIVLNVQKIKIKPQKDKQTPELQQKMYEKVNTYHQQIQQQALQKINQQTPKDQAPTKQNEQLPPKRPQNIKEYNQIEPTLQKFLTEEHAYMHLTANPHVLYLDQDNSFQEKHEIKVHAIILSKQKVNYYSSSLFGIPSRLWRFHGNQDIEKNSNNLKSFSLSFKKVQTFVSELYMKNLQTVNMLISLKKFIQKGDNDSNSTKDQNKKADNISEQTQKNIKAQVVENSDAKNTDLDKNIGLNKNDKQLPQNATTKQQLQFTMTIQQDYSPQVQEKLPTTYVQPQLINPLAQMKIYFHYPQTLRVEDLSKLVYVTEQNYGILSKLGISVLSYFLLAFIVSVLVGLFVRYAFFWIITLYLFIGGCFINKQWAWVQNYFKLIRNRDSTQNNVSLVSSSKMLIYFTFALAGIMTIFTIGSKFIMENLFINAIPLSENYFVEMFLKNYFMIELFYFVYCRSRTSLKYFPLFSIQISILLMAYSLMVYYYNITMIANLHMLLHLMLMCIFLAIENYVGNSKFHNQFTPSQQKPRALFYAGYDISWQNTLPPIWTYFTAYFDLKDFNEKQLSLINRDYQLLYGRLLGMNERQELPEDEENSQQEEVHKLNQNLSESNEMSLIR